MEIKNFWNLQIIEKYTPLNTIEEVLKEIKDGHLFNFELKDTFTPGEEITNVFDNVASKNNFVLNYTDNAHPAFLAIDRNSFYSNYINSNFFKYHEEEIKKAYIEAIKTTNNKVFIIESFMFSNELLDELLNIEDVALFLIDIDLTNEQIEKIKSKYIDATIIKKGIKTKISSRYVFSYYTKKALEEKNSELHVDLNDLQNSDIKNLIFLKENSVINYMKDENTPEEDELKIVKENLEKLDSLNKHFIYKIRIDKRSNFSKVFKDVNLKNIDLVIRNDFYDYPINQYLEEEQKLEDLVKDIKTSNLSPLEKFIAVYNIVKNYKPYKENQKELDKSRALRYILDNEYMVCVGYAKLLVELLDKVGIDATLLSVEVDTSYDDGFTLDEKIVEASGHKRAIISIDDNKYNLHGLYISDPTWDNSQKDNYLNNALLTFDKMQTDNRMFWYNLYNPVLDIHCFSDFNNQINFLLKRELHTNQNSPITKNDSYSQQLLNSYKSISLRILNSINCDPKYFELLNLLNNCKEEYDYEKFLTTLGNYLLKRINQPYNEELLFKANEEVSKIIKTNNNDENIKQNYYQRDIKQFPYAIPSDNDFRLEDRKKNL